MSHDIELDQEYLEKYAKADWMETSTGRKFWPAKPNIEDITVFDIAHALSLKCRYNGHSKTFYSVAEHAWSLAMLARVMKMPVSTQFHLLMHDANEAYLPDVPRPIKHFFPDLIRMEKYLDAMIREWCSLSDEVPSLVKEWDSRIIRDERRQVMMKSDNSWQTDVLRPLGVELSGFSPAEAETRFLQAFQLIGREHTGRPCILAYTDGEFASTVSDVKGFVAPNMIMIDMLGGCALAKGPDGPYFINGNFSLRRPG